MRTGLLSTKPYSHLILSLSIVMLFLTGCSEDSYEDLDRYIAEVKARPKGTIAPLPEIKVVEPFIFKPDGLRNPFTPVEKLTEDEDLQVAGGTGIRPDTARRKEELESYSLDTLRMVGTMRMKTNLWALVRASDGTIHRVKTGHHLGKNFGKIIRILEDRIELMEILPDNKPGFWREQQASLALAE